MSERKKLGLRLGEKAAGPDPRQNWGVSPERLERLRDHAKQMRRNPTEAEAALWEKLQAQRLGGFKFERKRIIGSAIADFACPARWLLVEVDGDAHDTPAIDESRDKKLTEVGLRILRFSAERVMGDADAVADEILAELQKPFDRKTAARQAASPGPSPDAEDLDAQKLLGIGAEGGVE